MGKRKRPQAADASSAAGPPTAKKNKKQHPAPPPSSSKSKSKSKAKPDTKPGPQPQVELELEREPETPHVFLSDPKGADLKAEVALYERLAHENPAERLYAAEAVISGLLGNGDAAYPGVDETTLLRHLEKKTLIRGLASGRKAARLGLSVVLTELWAQLFGENGMGEEERERRYPSVSFERCYGLLKDKMVVHAAVGGQEERDHKFGLLFGLQSFVKSGVCFGEGKEKNGRWEAVFGDLLGLAETKSWMREVCGSVIVQAIGMMSQAQAESTLEKVQAAGLGTSPEGVGIWLTARKKFPDMKFPSKPWGSNGNPLEHLKKLAKALKESSDPEGVKEGKDTKPTGNWNPQLHFVWDLVLNQYIEIQNEDGDNDDTDNRPELENFWKVAVDENLFSESASRERKFWGFLIFQKMLNDSTEIPQCIFSRNLIRCLINQSSNADRFLHRAAEKSLKVLQNAVEKDPQQAPAILKGITSNHGVYNFDQVTKTKTVDKILSTLNGANAVLALHILQGPIYVIETSDTVKDADSRRQLFGDYVLTVIRHANFAEDDLQVSEMVTTECIKILAQLAYGEDGEVECKPELSEKSRTLFRNRLASVLAQVVSYPLLASLIPGIVAKIDPSAVDMVDKIKEAEQQAKKTLKKLNKEVSKAELGGQRLKPSAALSLLYALVILQLWNGDADAIEVLDELKLCYDKLIRGKESDSDAEASAVLVEILLSFMSKSSLLLRKAAQQVFTAFSDAVTEEGLESMTMVLETSESKKGEQDLYDENTEDEGDEDEEDDDNEDELDSDVEMIETNGANGDVHSSSEDEDEDDEDESEEEEEDDEAAQSLDAALAKALGTHRLDQDLQEEASDSDADMTDSEMEKLGFDNKLNEIFSQRKKQPNKKKEQKDARENIINFKIRVLDLLEIYVKKQAKNPLAFSLIVPLLKLMRTTTAKHLTERAHGVIIAFVKASKGIKKDENAPVDVASRIDIMKLIHEEASRDLSHAFAKAASSASLLVASSLYREDKENFKKINEVYTETEERWMIGEAKLQAGLFVDKVNWCQSLVQSAASQ